jgi:WD40 repeat protein/transcriptional regulator with XRE-family HTH domain
MAGEGSRPGIADPGRVYSRLEFAHELTLLRERAGLTVRDVAKAIGVPDSTVGGYFSGRHLPPVKPPDILRSILAACGVRDVEVIEEWLEALSRVRRAPGRRPTGAPVPYRGLASFQPEDADWFYGRERLTETLVGHLSGQYVNGGLLVAVGPSGSGKSSLLRAGLIPALRGGALGKPGSGSWPIVLFTPGARPLRQLGGQIASMTGADPGQVASELLTRPDLCVEMIRERTARDADAGPGPGGGDSVEKGRVVLVIDQFEEIFTTCRDEAERQAFISALCVAAQRDTGDYAGSHEDHHGGGDPAALVVLGLRADFYPHALRYPDLVPALQEHQVLVGPMTEAELRSTITEPARRARLDVEDGLVEVLVRDLAPAGQGGQGLAHAAGTLPLLSHALLTTWERARRGHLTVADYEATGGIQGAVARTAEEVYAELTPAQQDLARRIFVRLVHVADDTADTRRRVPLDELLSQGDADYVLDCFIGERLVTADEHEAQITHEALLLAWPRLREWIDADRAGLRTHRQLTAAAEVWRDASHDPNTLYRGGLLAAASDWAEDRSHYEDLNALERGFLKASLEHERAEERGARRRTRRLQQLVAALTALVLITGFLTVFAFAQQAAATHQRNLAISRQVAIDANQLRSTDVALAMQLSLAAYQIAPTPEARSSLLDSYATPEVTRVLGSPGVMESVAFSRDDTVMAAAGEDATIRLWNIADRGHPVLLGHPLTGHTSTVFSVAFSPSGDTLASGSGDKTVRLWSVTPQGHASPCGQPLTSPANTVYSLAFSPDGRLLAAGSADDTIRLWDVTSPCHPAALGQPLRGPAGFVESVAFSHDGHLLAAGSADSTIRLWNVSNPGHPIELGGPLTGPAKIVYSVAFSPDGRLLAAGSADETVRLWNITNPRRPAPDGPPLKGPASWIYSVAFSPDGQSIAAASADSNVWVWNVASRKVTATLPHPAPVTTVKFLGNSHTIATSAADGTARIWEYPGPLISGPTGPIFTTTFSASSHVLAVTSEDNTARLWNVANPRQPVPLGPTITNTTRSGRASGAAALSPDGSTLVIGAVNGTCQVWDVRNPAQPVPLSRLYGPTGNIEGITYSADGHMLAIGSDDKTTWLWNVSNPAHPALLSKLTGPINYVYSPVFSPNGRILAVGGADTLVHLWDISNPRHPVPIAPALKGSTSYVYSVAFSPDGHLLAEGGADDEIRIWDINNPRHPALIGSPLTGPSNYVYSVAFSPDGDTLAATAGDGSVWLWDVTKPGQPQVLATLTGPTGAVFVDSFDTNRDILATGGNDGLARLWNIDTSQVAAYICSAAGTPITRAEWGKYIPGLPYHPPCLRTRTDPRWPDGLPTWILGPTSAGSCRHDPWIDRYAPTPPRSHQRG